MVSRLYYQNLGNYNSYTSGMIISNSEYFHKKQFYKKCKNKIKTELVTLVLFVFLCALIGTFMNRNRAETNYTFYYAQNKVVNKHTRGVFPPLQGHYSGLFGRWQVLAKIGSDTLDADMFQNYLIEFQQSGGLLITKKQSSCPNSKNTLIFHWNAFSYTLFISEVDSALLRTEDDPPANQTSDGADNSTANASATEAADAANTGAQPLGVMSDMQANQTSIGAGQNQSTNETECFGVNEQIVEYARSFTVWTLRDRNAYLISEAIINGSLDISIFVLSRY